MFDVSLYQQPECGRELFLSRRSIFRCELPQRWSCYDEATQGWEPSTEKMHGRDGVLKGAVTMAVKVGKEHYKCDFKTTYK